MKKKIKCDELNSKYYVHTNVQLNKLIPICIFWDPYSLFTQIFIYFINIFFLVHR